MRTFAPKEEPAGFGVKSARYRKARKYRLR